MIILYKGGRRASWHGLSQKEQDASSQAHVDLMLTVAEQHGLQRATGGLGTVLDYGVSDTGRCRSLDGSGDGADLWSLWIL